MADHVEEAMHEMIDGRDAEIDRLRVIARDAREMATGVLDLEVGCLAPEEMRAVAARIISATEKL